MAARALVGDCVVGSAAACVSLYGDPLGTTRHYAARRDKSTKDAA